MYISKRNAHKTALMWVKLLKEYTEREEPSWLFIGLQARETLGEVYALWKFDLISDEQWEELFDDIWFVKRKAGQKLNRMF